MNLYRMGRSNGNGDAVRTKSSEKERKVEEHPWNQGLLDEESSISLKKKKKKDASASNHEEAFVSSFPFF